MPPSGLARRLAAEALGTCALVLAGCGAVVVDAGYGGVIGHGGVAAAFGLVVAVMIFSVGHISGAHLNPAVTAAFAAARHFPARWVPAYWVAQCAGALAGALALRALFGLDGNLGVTHPDGVGDVQAVVIEAVLTAVLMTVILAVATDTRAQGQLAAIAVGAAVAMGALVMGPVTGASMNPARSLGPAAAAADLADLWIYIVGPVAGALAGAALYGWLRGHPASTAPDASPAPAPPTVPSTQEPA